MWRQVCKFSLYMKYKMLLSFSFVCMCVPLNLITPRQLRLISMMSVQRSVPRSLSCYIFCELKWNPTAFLVGFFAKPFMLILIASKDCTKQNQAQPGQVQTFLLIRFAFYVKKIHAIRKCEHTLSCKIYQGRTILIQKRNVGFVRNHT